MGRAETAADAGVWAQQQHGQGRGEKENGMQAKAKAKTKKKSRVRPSPDVMGKAGLVDCGGVPDLGLGTALWRLRSDDVQHHQHVPILDAPPAQFAAASAPPSRQATGEQCEHLGRLCCAATRNACYDALVCPVLRPSTSAGPFALARVLPCHALVILHVICMCRLTGDRAVGLDQGVNMFPILPKGTEGPNGHSPPAC
ncbi:hypothetical protein T440DRAFT_552604 [Plenodomus tracheiphilus IPT5]|uniref:Uncharacterized protein n=1 Tax=Plenodomus tracheiphilus IPT5 TaxID=1408161 RepID=A0A6A7BH19_9PLEO|nr:hypothetical protein T440DRAFT_552604 [Plenodomus tracheiphilus IPT5]